MKDKVKHYLFVLGFLAFMAVILFLFHDYIDTYSNSLMVMITFVYVVATVEICRANINSAKATREQNEELKRQFDEENRAFVTVSLEVIRNGLTVIHIQNFGKLVAENVNVQIDNHFIDNLPNAHAQDNLKSLSNSKFMLGIGQSRYVFIGTSPQNTQIGKETLSVDLSYSDSKKKYKEHIEIDLSQYYWALIYDSPEDDLCEEIKKMTKHISSIDSSLKYIKQDNSEERI